eukprot:gene4072-biopygen12892
MYPTTPVPYGPPCPPLFGRNESGRGPDAGRDAGPGGGSAVPPLPTHCASTGCARPQRPAPPPPPTPAAAALRHSAPPPAAPRRRAARSGSAAGGGPDPCTPSPEFLPSPLSPKSPQFGGIPQMSTKIAGVGGGPDRAHDQIPPGRRHCPHPVRVRFFNFYRAARVRSASGPRPFPMPHALPRVITGNSTGKHGQLQSNPTGNPTDNSTRNSTGKSTGKSIPRTGNSTG